MQTIPKAVVKKARGKQTRGDYEKCLPIIA